MADTYTTNLNMTKPEVGASTDSWGTKLNADLDTLDAIFAAGGTAVNVKFASANFDDNAKAIFGTGDDLEIYHSGSHSIIKDGGTGNLLIQGDSVKIMNAAGDETFIDMPTDSYVALNYNNSTKIQTSNTGATVTGNIANTSGDMTLDVAGNIILDADGDATKFADGGTEYGKIYGASSNLYVSSTVQDKDILFVGDDGGSSVTALTLDMSDAGSAYFNNKVGIGTTSPSHDLTIQKSGQDNYIRIGSNADGNDAGVYFGNNADWSIGIDNSNSNAFSIASGSTVGTNPRLTIDSSGNVGIGSSSPASYYSRSLVVSATAEQGITIAATGTSMNNYLMFADGTTGNEAYRGYVVYSHTLDRLGFASGGSERMHIISDGTILMGRTTSSVGGDGHRFSLNGESFHMIDSASAVTTLHVYDSADSAYRFYVDGSGTNAGRVNATQTSINGLSDIRLKENITDLETGLDEILALKPRRFDWKKGEGSKQKNVAGFIAQEVETILPDLIGDFKHEIITDAKSVKMGDMIPTLVKAIQEQQTQIDALQSEINTLKGE